MRRFSNQSGPKVYHSGLKRVQAHFGLTQQELADALGVSRATLTMAAGNRRSLPPEAGQRLLYFLQALPAPTPADAHGDAPAPPAPLFTADDQQDLDLRRRSLLLQASLLDEQLARGHIRLAQARLRLQALPGLQAAFPADDELAQALFKVWRNQANATLRTEPGSLARLALRQAVLAFEAAGIAKLLAEA